MARDFGSDFVAYIVSTWEWMREILADPDHPDWLGEIHEMFSLLSLTRRAEPANREEAEALERVRQEIGDMCKRYGLVEPRPPREDAPDGRM